MATSLELDAPADCTPDATPLSTVHALLRHHRTDLTCSASFRLLVLLLVLDARVPLFLLPLRSEALIASNLQ